MYLQGIAHAQDSMLLGLPLFRTAMWKKIRGDIGNKGTQERDLRVRPTCAQLGTHLS